MDVAEVNEAMAELLLLKAFVKEYESRIDELNTWCKSQGSFSTDRFVVAITERSRQCMVSVEKAVEIADIGWLKDKGLIQTVNFEVVNVSVKK